MTIDASAVARTVGVDVQYRDLRGGGVLFLPQRIAIFAQGATAISYSATKWQATSASAVGSRYGFGSPAHLAARELMPVNGDGVGTIPVTIYPLTDAASSVASTGGIVPSGTATVAAAYRIRVNGILGESFVVPIGAVVLSTLLGLIGESIANVLEMPVNRSYTYGTVTASAITGTGNGTLTALSVAGTTTRPGAYTLTCLTAVANGGVWKLTDPVGTVLSSTLTMTPGVGAATVFTVGGLTFTLTDGTTDFGAGAVFTITVPATACSFVSKWKGESANRIFLEVIGDYNGVSFAITQPTGGLVDPDPTTALAQMGNIWESMVLNALSITNTTALDIYQTFGEGRWGELVKKPLVCFTGVHYKLVGDATAVSTVRRTDRINCQLVAPGSVNLPFVIAARQLARIAKQAQNNPPSDYGSQKATGLTPGADGDQWDYPTRDQAIKNGSSTVEVKDGVVSIGDVVTFYRPTGEDPPAYRYVVDIVKLQQCVYNLDLAFSNTDWDGAPLIPDDQATVNPMAKKPKTARALVGTIIDSLAANAIISDPASAKKSMTAVINAQNPKRLDVTVTVKLAGNANVIGTQLNFGFFFGGLAAA